MLLRSEYGLHDVVDIAQKIISLIPTYTIFTFQGPIGAGKTTLIKAILHLLNVTDTIVSPTFSYVALYHTKTGQPIYHFDLYRIKTITEFEQMGFDEYIYDPNALVFIEWPSLIETWFKKPVCMITIDYNKNPEKRIITIIESDSNQ